MTQVSEAGFIANSETRFPTQTNEEISALDMRAQDLDTADSVVFKNDVANISGEHTYTTNPNVLLTPTSDTHPVSKKYFDDNASPSAGDVTGVAGSIDNHIVVWDGITGKAIKNGTGVELTQTGDFNSVGNVAFATATKTIAGIQNGNLLDKSISQTVSAAWTFSSNITSIAPTVDLHLATKKYVDDNSGTGDVTKVGTPLNNQLGVWTGDGTIEGDPNLTWDGSTFSIGGELSLNSLTVDNIVLDGNDISTSSGDLTFNPTGDFLVQSGNVTFSGDVAVGSGSSNITTLTMDATAGNTRRMLFTSAGSARWAVRTSSDAESGSNAGSNFTLLNYNDSGNLTGTPLEINRASGNATFTGDVSLLGGDLDVSGHISYQVGISAKSANYTMVNSDNGKIISCTNSITINVPASGITNGWTVQVVNEGSGTVTIGDNGETINSKGVASPLLESQWGGCTIYYDGTDFVAIGDLS